MTSSAPTPEPHEGRIARSWRLSVGAWQIIRSDRAILVLAVLSALFAVAGLALVYDLTGAFGGHRHTDTTRFVLVTALLSLPLTFVSVFFNTAIAAAAAGVLEGRTPSLGEALSVPLRRIGQVALWSLMVSVVGFVINQIASRLPFLGSIAVRLVGLSWSLATLFAVPILATEGCSAPACVKRSAALVKKRWGEGIGGNVIITAWAVVAVVPLVIVFAIASAAFPKHSDGRVAMLATLVVVLALLFMLAGVVREVFGVVLFRYAQTGQGVGGFTASDLDSPFSRRGGLASIGGGGRPAGLRPRGRASLLAWGASALAGGAAVLALELGKRHYAAHHLAGRVIAAVMIWALVTVLVRGVIWLVVRVGRAAKA